MLIAAPWFGWSLALGGWIGSSIFSGLAASEKLAVLGQNALQLVRSPVSLLTGLSGTISMVTTVIVLLWCVIARRQLVPDLFVALYCLVLLCRTSPPERSVAAVLPLVLWILWRVLRLVKSREAVAALVVIASAFALWADLRRPVNWTELQKLFTSIRANTPPDAVLLTDLDGMFFLNTGRKAIRGFNPNGYDLSYAPRQSSVSPDQLSKAILEQHVSYVVLVPDRNLPESEAFHRSIEALEHGGVVEPVDVPGESRGYQLFKVSR
jgi:hypothetical protein